MKRSSFFLLLMGFVTMISLSSCFKEVGSLSGYVIDSQTGDGLANVKVSVTKDMTVTTGDDANKSTTTLTDGSYFMDNIEIGTYRLIIEADGYFARIVSDIEIIEGENVAEQQIIVETPESGSFRIVLIWGENPYDLDSHLTGPDAAGGRFHVYYGNDYNSDMSVDLDVDDTYSYGPETTTIYSFMNGTYRYSVHNYSDQGTTGGSGIHASPARVEVYDENGMVESFDAPVCSVSANAWRVFEIISSGGTATINPVNQYVTAAYSSDSEAFKSAGPKQPMDIAGF